VRDSAASDSGVTAELRLATDTVRKWRTWFAQEGWTGGRIITARAVEGGADAERVRLARWARRAKTSQALLRSRG
jgi:hypothetical protein